MTSSRNTNPLHAPLSCTDCRTHFDMRLLLLLLLSAGQAAACIDAPSETASQEEVSDRVSTQGLEQSYLHQLAIAREQELLGERDCAARHYRELLEHPFAANKMEAAVKLVLLMWTDSASHQDAATIARDWFLAHPDHFSPPIREWLTEVEVVSRYGSEPPPFPWWVVSAAPRDFSTPAKARAVYAQPTHGDFTDLNINEKIRLDIIAALALGRDAPRLWCAPTLERYPESITWSMRICRFLEDWRLGRPPRESVRSVRQQLRVENPQRLSWADVLEAL